MDCGSRRIMPAGRRGGVPGIRQGLASTPMSGVFSTIRRSMRRIVSSMADMIPVPAPDTLALRPNGCFVAIQSTRGSALATRLAVDVASPQTNVAIINGHAYFKSDSTILVLAGLPGWSWSRIFLLLPRRVRDWAYDRIARNRYRLFGRNESCLVPTSAIAARFVLDDPSEERP